MPKLKPTHISPTDKEEEAIQVGIANDPDSFELDDEWFRRARPASEVHPELVKQWRQAEGKPELPSKETISLRLDADVVDHFRSVGPGWQSRINEILRRAVFGSLDNPGG